MRRYINKEIVSQALGEIIITRHMHYRTFLRDLYASFKKLVKPYSYIKFSEDLGTGPNNVLRLIIIGERKLTIRNATLIADSLGLVKEERRYFLELVRFNNAKNSSAKEASFKKLGQIQSKLSENDTERIHLEFFSQWYNPAIWELSDHPGFTLDPEWIKDKLTFPVRPEQIKKSLELLSRLGLIIYSARDDRHVKSEKIIDTGINARGYAMVGFHQEMIEKGKEAVTSFGRDKREITCATVSLPPEKIKELTKMVREFIRDAATMECDSSSDDQDLSTVMQLNIQLFPLTKD